MLQNHSFIVHEQLTGRVPFGATGRTCRSIKGNPLEIDTVFTSEVGKMIANNMSVGAFTGGYLEDLDGTPITTEEGRLKLMQEFNKRFDEHGVLIQAVQIKAIRK